MTSSVKPIESEGCDIIQGRDLFLSRLVLSTRQTGASYESSGSCLDLSCRPTKLAPGMSHKFCDRAMKSSVKPIANEACDIIQGRDLFLSRLVLYTHQTGASHQENTLPHRKGGGKSCRGSMTSCTSSLFQGHDLFLSLLVLSSRQTGARNHMLDSDVSFKDQGGGCVVHASGGILALFGALFLGRRILFLKELDESSLPPSSPCCTLMGYALVLLGLTAFSLPTPRYELTRWPDNYIGVIVMNIVMSSSGGAITVVLLQLLVVRDSFTYWPMLRCVQGALAGIVVILPGVDVYRPLVTLAIGLSVGVILFIGARQTYQSAIEDYANVIIVHLVCGFLGVLLPPLLGSAENLGTRSSHHVMAHLGWQMICGSVLVLVVAAIMFPVFVILTCLGFLRNKEDARHHRRALVLQKQLSKRVFFRRLLKLDNSHDVLIPGYESKSSHPQFLDGI
uniref:Ammonium transporter AmtB-like domain-containing protein n=1 Tax=Timema cristinae TaxID=61476 RepID=A0A7R9DKL3_TIMCR|nr:unnamed protein product [Timema cristinae]